MTTTPQAYVCHEEVNVGDWFDLDWYDQVLEVKPIRGHLERVRLTILRRPQ